MSFLSSRHSLSRRLSAVSSILVLGLSLGACVTRETVATAPPPEQAPSAMPAPVAPETPPMVYPPPMGNAAGPQSPLADKIIVGLLLPLSGPNGQLGRDMLDAAQMALFDLGGDNLALVPKDTEGTPAGAYGAAKSLIDQGARLILGPLTSGEVETVRPVAKAANVSIVAFSNQSKVAGDGVFVLGFLPQQEAQRLAAYIKASGIDHAAALAPSSPYGQLAVDSFASALTADGGTLDRTVWYDPESGDPRASVQRLAGPAQSASQTQAAGATANFGALLIPEPSPRKLMSLAALLPIYDLDPHQFRLLGTDGWDFDDLGSEPALVGGWFAATPPEARADFEKRFETDHGRRPQRLAALAYESVGMASVLARAPTVDFSAAALTNPSGFAGPNGLFRLKPDGTTERGLAVLQVERHGATTVSPAPESFDQAGQ